jgi:tetratricopeptide (TPR) repeat protein
MATTQARQRLTKHQLKQDAFSTAIFTAREWIQQNLRLVLIVLGGIVVVVALIWGVNSYRASRAEAAAELFGQAGIELRGGNLAAGIVSLRKLLDQYSGATIAGVACVELADAYFRQRSFDEAKTYFQKYLDNYGSDNLLKAASLAGLGGVDEQASANAEAAKKYLEAADINPKSFQATEYLQSALRCAIALNDSAQAVQIFKMIQKDAPANDQTVRLLRQNMIEHGFLVPQEN